MAADVDIGFSDEALPTGALLSLRLIHKDDEVLKGIGDQERQRGIIHQKLGRVYLQRLHVTGDQIEILVL